MAAVNKNFVVKNGIEVGDNLIYGDKTTLRVGIGTTTPGSTLEVRGGIGATNVSVGQTLTANVGIITSLTSINSTFGQSVVFRTGIGTELTISGVTTTSDLRVSGVATVTTLNATGIAATSNRSTWSQVGSGLTFTTGIATNFTVSGVATVTTLNATGIAVTAERSTWSQVGSGLTFTTGIGTNLSVSGVSSVGSGITLASTGDARFAGIITAQRFIGDGSGLTGTISGVGIQSGGVLVGSAITTLNFIGSAVTSITASAGIATINLLAGAGGGGVPGGSQGQVQYNNASTFTGSSNFTFDGSNVRVGGSLTAIEVDTAWQTVGLGLTFTTGIGTNLSVSGVATVTTLNATGVIATTNASTWSQVGSGLTFTTGIGTFANVTGILTAANLNVTGIGTIGNIALRSNASGGIITATTGIVTYFGDGSRLSGISTGLTLSGVGTVAVQYLTYSSASAGSTTGFGVSTSLVYNPSSRRLGIGTTSANAGVHVVNDLLVSAGAAATLDIRLKAYTNESGSLSFENSVDASSVLTFSQGYSDILFDVSTSPLNQVFKVGIDSSISVSSGVATRDIKIKAYQSELGALSFEDAVDATQYFSITQDVSTMMFGVNDNSFNNVFMVAPTGFTSATQLRINSVSEHLARIDGNTANIVWNTGGDNIGFCTNPTGDITLNVTGIPTDGSFNNSVLTFTVIINQTGTARSCTAVNLNGLSRPIRWAGGSLQRAIIGVTTTLGYDIYSFTGINTVGSASTLANYQVLGTVNGGYR